MDRKEQQSLVRAGAIGLELGGAVIVCLLAGSWADNHFGTTPWLTLAGVVIGTIAGLAAVVRTAKTIQDKP